jgi:hypothetical protein
MWLFKRRIFGAKETVSLNMEHSRNNKEFTEAGAQ